MSPLNVAICTTISYTLWVEWYYLKKNIIWPWGQRSRSHEGHYGTRTHCIMVMHPHTNYHWPISKDKNVMAQTRKHYLKNNYLTLRSKSHEGHYGMRHTTLWLCTHIPNIIDLSGKTKKLWSGQASLRRSRRSGRKNQTKTMSPFFRRVDIIMPVNNYNHEVGCSTKVRTKFFWYPNVVAFWEISEVKNT